mmetsp:Transcript_6680/g.7526  ORF Transcript_6680/g.7526 Transcript_6680/m.7526 type:complete len:87 (+) Transcript_6680:2287-2547(+)
MEEPAEEQRRYTNTSEKCYNRGDKLPVSWYAIVGWLFLQPSLLGFLSDCIRCLLTRTVALTPSMSETVTVTVLGGGGVSCWSMSII